MKKITTREAAELAGVSQVTIQNLCRNNALRYSKKGYMYMVNREDVEKYIEKIQTMHNDLEDIEKMSEEYKEKRISVHKDLDACKFRLHQMYMFPERMSAIMKISSAALRRYESYFDVEDFNIVLSFLENGYKSYTISQTTDECIRSSLRNVCRKMLQIKSIVLQKEDEIDKLKKENDSLRSIIRNMIEGEKCGLREEDVELTTTLLTKLVDVDLSVRALNCCKAYGIVTFADVIYLGKSEMLKCRNFGKKSLNEICNAVEKAGLSFDMNVKDLVSDECLDELNWRRHGRRY